MKDDTVIVGKNVDKKRVLCPHCKVEFHLQAKDTELIAPYIMAVLQKMANREHIFLETFNHPERLAKITQIYEYLRPWGVTELFDDRDVFFLPRKDNPKATVKMLRIKWTTHPKLVLLRKDQDNIIKKNG